LQKIRVDLYYSKEGVMEVQEKQTEAQQISRRTFVKRIAAAVAATAAITAIASHEPDALQAQEPEGSVSQYGPDAPPVRYPRNDVIGLDPRFTYGIGNTPIQRLYTGMLWAEGPAWNGVGNYLIWSDIPNNVQHRWLHEDGHVSVFRNPSGNSNGNTFDLQGRQISCEHLNRRVVRYEHDGSMTVLADNFDGTPFNSPNDAVVHPDGGIWFTDPPYGSWGNYEGNKGEIESRKRSTASTQPRPRLLWSPMRSINPTASVSPLITASCMWSIPAMAPSMSGMWSMIRP
jgi:hypothetical protein